MPETADPLAALDARDIPTRAAGARDLALRGTPANVSRLIGMAVRDPSPGVYLSAAAAAADILSRYRRNPLPEAERQRWWNEATASDPRVNASLFQICAMLDLPGVLTRITRGLRDPRADVRTGACVGLLRFCQSSVVNGDTTLAREVVSLAADGRIRQETRIDIARVAALVGYREVLPTLQAMLAEGGANQAEQAAEAIAWVEGLPGGEGVWMDQGRDAGEVNPEAKPQGTIVIRSDAVHGEKAILVPESLTEKPSFIELSPVRRGLWLKRPDVKEREATLQVGDRTLFPADPDEVAEATERLLAAEAWDLIEAVEGAWPETAVGFRLRGATRLGRGDLDGAIALLSMAMELKKVPADTSWYLAEALRLAGREGEARHHYERFANKGKQKDPRTAVARERIGG